MPSEFGEQDEKTTKDCGVKSGKTVYTWQDLSKFNQKHNAHVAVRGKVYDVSSFVDRHPGGVEQILIGAGRDITQLFESYHPFSAYRVLEKFYVGELITNEHPVFPEPGEFHRTVKEQVANYFKENNIVSL
ncbi:uncharacterized protein [Dysidea avara]|uniref:uncharacterized protein n=1 Tax=Dysidea avara TaxID=196820 RepID=UPI00332E2269